MATGPSGALQKETSALVAEVVDLDNQMAAAARHGGQLNSPSDVDTASDPEEEEAEYERWKRRELARIKREEAMRDPSAKLRTEADAAPAKVRAAGAAGTSVHCL